MIKLSWKALAVTVGGLAVSSTVLAGVASADPLVDTTCTYPQIIAAMNANDPALAQTFASSSLASSTLSRFLASPPAERQRMATQLRNSTLGQKYIVPVTNIANICNQY